jgi:hypothetical protein
MGGFVVGVGTGVVAVAVAVGTGTGCACTAGGDWLPHAKVREKRGAKAPPRLMECSNRRL